MTNLSTRRKLVLAALAADAANAQFAPVQVQKLFFLLDRNIADEMGGEQFAFEPYDFGPFDREVYSELEALARKGLLDIREAGPRPGDRRYSLTRAGYDLGQKCLLRIPPRGARYMKKAATWVRSLNFAELVGSIYKQYPEMRAKSVFRS
jgi:hypothetical protein